MNGQHNTWAAARVGLCLALSIGLASRTSSQRGGSGEDGSAAVLRDVTERWVQTRGLIDKERNDWTLARSLLDDRIELVRAEIAAVQERTAEARRSKSEADATYAELTAKSERLSAATESLSDLADHAAGRLGGIFSSFPEPLKESVQAITEGVVDSEETSGLSLSDRFLHVLGILNAAGKFNAAVHTASELREASDGSLVQADVIYLGLGAGFYVTGDDAQAGVGSPGPDGWSWSANDAIAASVRSCIDVFENKAAPAFVRLPVQEN